MDERELTSFEGESKTAHVFDFFQGLVGDYFDDMGTPFHPLANQTYPHKTVNSGHDVYTSHIFPFSDTPGSPSAWASRHVIIQDLLCFFHRAIHQGHLKLVGE